MVAPTANSDTDPDAERSLPGSPEEDGQSGDALAFASVALSAAGFLTLLRLADRRDRTPFRALALFLATTSESVAGTVLGLRAVGRSRSGGGAGASRGFLLGAGGAVLGVVTMLLNFNWMRTRRRI
jgi:hypothetical protein